jgi:TatD DNase family protein
MRILRDEGAAEIGGVIHCFTENWEMATQFLALGFYISFSGIITFKNVKQIHDVVRRMPTERILVETDSPYLTPIPHRGKPNNPAWVRDIADYVANLRGESLSQVANFTSANYSRLFSLPLEEMM